MPFIKFIKHYRKEDSDLGTFSRIVKHDKNIPKDDEYDSWIGYLKTYYPSKWMTNNFNRFWEISTLVEEDEPDPISEPYIPNGNEKKSYIELLKFPNYWHDGNDNSDHPPLIKVLTSKIDLKYHDIFTKRTNTKTPLLVGRKLLGTIALYGKYFKYEFHYDFLPYRISNHKEEGCATIQPYIFLGRNKYSGEENSLNQIGVCVFQYLGQSKEWELKWVWIHPFYRNQGHLSNSWKEFKNIYGDFKVSYPYSPAMEAFLKKNKKHKQE